MLKLLIIYNNNHYTEVIPAVVSSTDPAPGALSPGLLGHYSAVSVSYPAVTQTSTHIEKKKKTLTFSERASSSSSPRTLHHCPSWRR